MIITQTQTQTQYKLSLTTFKSKINLELFDNVKNLIEMKYITFKTLTQFDKDFNDNKHLYAIKYDFFKKNNKKIVKTFITYPYKNIQQTEIYDLYYNDILYERFAFDFKTIDLKKYINKICIYNVFSFNISNICIDKVYKCIQNNQTFDLIKFISNNVNSNLRIDLFNFPKNKPNEKKQIINGEIEVIESNKFNETELKIIHMNTEITTLCLENFTKTIIRFLGNKNRKGKTVGKFTDTKNDSEAIINDNNNLLNLKISGEEVDINESIVGYKIASVMYNNVLQDCIIELRIPKDAKISSDNHGKFRCNKLIPYKVYIDNDSILQEIKVDCCMSKIHTSDFKYNIGKLCVENDFDGNLDSVCVPGLHFYMSIYGLEDYSPKLIKAYKNSNFTQ